MLNLDNFSIENLRKIQQVLKVILDAWELIEPEKDVRIPFQKIEQVGLPDFWPVIRKLRNGERELILLEPTNLQEYRQDSQNEKERILSVWVKNGKRLKELYGEIIKRLELAQSEKEGEILSFDSLNGVFYYGGEIYKIRSGKRIALVRKLWEEHKKIKQKTGEVVKKGLPFPKEALFRNIEVLSTIKELKEEIKALNRGFRSHHIPAKITMKGGVQLIVEA